MVKTKIVRENAKRVNENANLILTILTGKNCVLLNSVQNVFGIEAWLLLMFFICLHNQLSSIHSIVTF